MKLARRELLLALLGCVGCNVEVLEQAAQANPDTTEREADEDMPAAIVNRVTPNVALLGNSRIWGSQGTPPEGGDGSPPGQLAQLLGIPYDVLCHNLGVSGLGSRDLPNPLYLQRSGHPFHVVIAIGINDIVIAGDSPVTIMARLIAFVNMLLARGVRVTVCTIEPHHAVPSSLATVIAFNQAIRDEWPQPTSPVKIADFGADPDLGTSSAPPPGNTYFFIDGVHLTNLGNTRRASIIAPTIPSTWMLDPVITAADRPAITDSLTGWFDDWITVTAVEPLSVYTQHNKARPRAFDRYVDLAGTADPPLRLQDQLNARAVTRFPGNGVDQNAYYQSNAVYGSDFVSPTSFLFRTIIKPTEVHGTELTNVHWNDGVVMTAGGFGFGLMLWDDAGTPKAQLWADDGVKRKVSLAITLDAWVHIACRLTGGQLGLSVDGGATWPAEVACGAITDLTGPLRIGQNAAGTHSLFADMATLIIRNAYIAGENTSDRAHTLAAWGL